MSLRVSFKSQGSFTLPPNQNWQVGRFPTHASGQLLYLIEWEVDEQRFGNHYLAGSPPFGLERYLDWLKKNARLNRPFDLQNGSRLK